MPLPVLPARPSREAGELVTGSWASGVVLMIFAVWLFVRTFWGGLPHRLAGAVS